MHTVIVKQHLKKIAVQRFQHFWGFYSGTITQQFMSKKNGPYLKHKSTTTLNAISRYYNSTKVTVTVVYRPPDANAD